MPLSESPNRRLQPERWGLAVRSCAATRLLVSLQALLLLVSLGVLTVGAELLVRGALALGHRMGLSPLFLGVTVVGFGTSTPELCTSLLAGVDGLDDIAVGNVVGSNTFNIAIILGSTAV
ncbi:MAG: hypothetical protein H6836_05635, partial [Planctomycetes bacterium]|nr:hypothetical protein [Planctomycetota bacterium]